MKGESNAPPSMEEIWSVTENRYQGFRYHQRLTSHPVRTCQGGKICPEHIHLAYPHSHSIFLSLPLSLSFCLSLSLFLPLSLSLSLSASFYPPLHCCQNVLPFYNENSHAYACNNLSPPTQPNPPPLASAEPPSTSPLLHFPVSVHSMPVCCRAHKTLLVIVSVNQSACARDATVRAQMAESPVLLFEPKWMNLQPPYPLSPGWLSLFLALLGGGLTGMHRPMRQSPLETGHPPGTP